MLSTLYSFRYLTTISDCYAKLTLASCEPGFQNSLKENSKMLSTNLCRNADGKITMHTQYQGSKPNTSDKSIQYSKFKRNRDGNITIPNAKARNQIQMINHTIFKELNSIQKKIVFYFTI